MFDLILKIISMCVDCMRNFLIQISCGKQGHRHVQRNATHDSAELMKSIHIPAMKRNFFKAQ